MNDARIITIIVAVTGAVLFAYLAMMAEPTWDGVQTTQAGSWYKVDPPPHAHGNTECWVWQNGALDNRMGGPYCFVPENDKR